MALQDLTKKQRGFVKDYVETENGTQSALSNYDTDKPEVANAIAVENLQKPLVIEAILELKKSIAEQLPDEELVKVHLEGLKANRTYKNIEDGTETVLEPDYATRHKYLDSAYKLKGSYAAEKKLNINLEVEATKDDLELAEIINNERRNTRGHIESKGIEAQPVGREVPDQE